MACELGIPLSLGGKSKSDVTSSAGRSCFNSFFNTLLRIPLDIDPMKKLTIKASRFQARTMKNVPATTAEVVDPIFVNQVVFLLLLPVELVALAKDVGVPSLEIAWGVGFESSCLALEVVIKMEALLTGRKILLVEIGRLCRCDGKADQPNVRCTAERNAINVQQLETAILADTFISLLWQLLRRCWGLV